MKVLPFALHMLDDLASLKPATYQRRDIDPVACTRSPWREITEEAYRELFADKRPFLGMRGTDYEARALYELPQSMWPHTPMSVDATADIATGSQP